MKLFFLRGFLALFLLFVFVRILFSPFGVACILRTQGLKWQAGSVSFGLRQLRSEHLMIASSQGEPVFSALRINAAYDLLALLRGQGQAKNGVVVELEQPKLWLYPASLAGGSSAGAGGMRLPGHLRLRLTIHNGVVALVQPHVLDPQARQLELTRVNLRAQVDTDRETRYQLSAAAGTGLVHLQGLIDAPRGSALHRVEMDRWPVAHWGNAFIDSSAFRLQAGEVAQLHGLVYGVAAPGQAVLGDHIVAQAQAQAVVANLQGIDRSLEDLRAHVDISDDTMTFAQVSGRLGVLPFAGSGAVFALNEAEPQLQFALTGAGDMQDVRSLFRFSRDLPIAGHLNLRATIEGGASAPMISVDLAGQHLAYAGQLVDLQPSRLVYRNNEVLLAPVALHYGEVQVAGAGAISVSEPVHSQILLMGSAPSAALPYAQLLFGGQLDAFALISGDGQHLDARSYLAGWNGSQHLQALLHLDPQGGGVFGPLVVEQNGQRTLLAGGTLAPQQSAWLGVTLSAGQALEPLGVALDGPLALAGAPGQQLTTGQVLLHGDLAQLGDIFGVGGLQGTVTLPLTVSSGTAGVELQVGDAGLRDVKAFGVPLRSFQAAVLFGSQHTVVTALLGLPRGEIVASGDLDQNLGLSFRGLSALGGVSNASLSGALLWSRPLQQGPLAGVALGGAVIAANPFTLTTRFTLTGSALDFQGGLLQLPGVLAHVDGAVGDAWRGTELALSGQVFDGELEPTLNVLFPQAAHLMGAGSVAADVRLSGNWPALQLNGQVSVPEGQIAGLPLRGGRSDFAWAPHAWRIDQGRISVGGSALEFALGSNAQGVQASLLGRTLDLADFNPLFDQDAFLAGTGHVQIQADLTAMNIQSAADIHLADVRVGSIVLGSAQALWQTHQHDVEGNVRVVGPTAELALTGGLHLPRIESWSNVMAQSRLEATARLNNVDLERWLPLVGFNGPLSGHFDGTAHIFGLLPAPMIDATMSLHDAQWAIVPITMAQAHIVAENGRATIEQAQLVIPSTAAQVSGSFGFGANDPLALVLHAQTPDIGLLLAKALPHLGSLGERLRPVVQPLTGTLATALQLGGTVSHPQLDAAVDATEVMLHGVAIPRAQARFALEANHLQVTDLELAFEKGSVSVAGRLPLVLDPFVVGPAQAPLGLDVRVAALHLAAFTPWLPPKSTLRGIVDGIVSLRGTPASPQLFGGLNLSAGAFAAPIESTLIDGIQSTVHLDGRQVMFTTAATVGGGVFRLDGQASVENLMNFTDQFKYRVYAAAHKAELNIANMGRGTLDADLTLTHQDTTPPHLQGEIKLSDAQIPVSLFYNPAVRDTAVADSLFSQMTLDVQLVAGNNARVRSGNIDLGAIGSARLGGSIAQPTLDGSFAATGGSLTYFNRLFHIGSGLVVFDPNDGIDPQITASANTVVNNPDRNTAYNTSGRVTINLHLQGSLDHLQVNLSSDPSYDRQQILGLLLDAPLLGAVQFGGVTGLGAAGNSGQLSVSQEAFSFVNAQFTQSLLAPISSALGGAVGLSDLAVNFDTAGSLDVSARRHIVKNVYAFFRDSLGMPTRESLGVDFEPNDATAVSVSIFQEALFNPQQTLLENAPLPGEGAMTRGILFSLTRRFP